MFTIGYYTLVILALRYSSPAVCALILGIHPITIAFYGNWQQKETSHKNLILPSLLILVGLVLVNIPHILTSPSSTYYMLGLLFSFLALLIWSWHVVSNARFLKHHPKVRAGDWATMIGVATLFWVVIIAIILVSFFSNQLHLAQHFLVQREFIRFVVGSAILGVLCSWVGTFFWNQAIVRLPVSLAGQLTIFETIFGILFIYIVSMRLPAISEMIGVVILLTTVAYCIKKFAKKRDFVKEIEPH